MHFIKVIILAAMLASTSTAVLAQHWIAERLRGSVLQLESSSWVALEHGDVVPDGRKIRTLGDGRVELVRGQERIALAGNTEIAIRDAAGQKMTSVIQTLGSVTIEAERRNVQHFSVQTPVLAAVVKGTQFTVTYSNGQARVDVDRGVVQVQDSANSMVVDVIPGQSAAAGRGEPLDVSGPGADRVIYLIEGEVVPAVAREAVLSGALAAKDALEAVEARAVPGANASANAGETGNRVSANSRGDTDGDGRGGGGPPEHSNAGGNSANAGNNSASGNASSAGAGPGGNAGPPDHSNAGGNGGGGPPEHSNAGGSSSNSGSNGNGNGKKDD